MGMGDELMVTGIARKMQETDPRRVRVLYERPRWPIVFDHNPRLAALPEVGDFQVLHGRINGLRPYVSAKSQTRWTWKDYKPEPGEIYLTQREHQLGKRNNKRIIIEPNLKGSGSPNKDWGRARWQELVRLMALEGIRPTQMGTSEADVLPGVEYIRTSDFREACAVMSRARAAVLPEGGLHHAAAALKIPSVVLFGGFISPRQTGYDSQVNLFTGGEPCGWRTPCAHCAEAMAKIEPEMVMVELLKLLGSPTVTP